MLGLPQKYQDLLGAASLGLWTEFGYSGFFKSLRTSTSIVSRDIQTTTGRNIRLVEESSGLAAWNTSSGKLKEAIGNLNKLLGHKQEQSYLGIDTEDISGLINSLCIN